MRIEKVALHELDGFIKSDLYKQLEVKPITTMRAASYLRNPHARPNDTVLFLLLKGSKLIAFRSLFTGKLTNDKEPFGWLSGNWVHPDFRHQGHSEKLLEEAFKDWNNRLMFTNYAPASLQQYLKTKKFKPLHDDKGTRFYLFAKPSKILKERTEGIMLLLILFDFCVKIWASLKNSFYKPVEQDDLKIEVIEKPDEECFKYMKAYEPNSFFERTKKIFKWIFEYQWISTADKRFITSYPFTSYSDSFGYQTIKIYSGSQFMGYLLFSIRDGHLKTLYQYLDKKAIAPAAQYIANLASSNKLEMATILDPELAEAIKNSHHPFIHSKKIDHKIYASFPSSDDVGKVQSGDGDFVFS